MSETTQGGLTAAEEAYFESGGEAPLDAAEPPVSDNQQQEQATDQQPQPEGEGQQRDEKGRYVPHGALHAEREEHKKTRSELNELREKWARIEERMQWMQQAAQPPQTQQQEETPPDPNEDVFAALKWTQDQLIAAKKANEEARAQTEAQQREQQAERQIWDYWEQDSQQYIQQNADFPNAAKWLSEFRDKQLSAYATIDQRFADPRLRNAQIEAELKQIVVTAAQQRKSPAQYVYELAKGYGYAPQAGAQGIQLPEQLQRVQKAQDASKSLSQAPGRAGGEETSLETIMSMGRAEFDVWIKDAKNERLFNKLLGA